MPSNPFAARGVSDSSGRTYSLSGGSSAPGASVPTFTGNYNAGVDPNLEEITNLINQLNITAQQQSNAGRIPNATGLEQQSSANIASQLSGELPADVVNQIAQAAAERGVGGGFSGSPNDTAAYLKALGLTSYDMTQQGQSNLSAALGRNPGASTFDPSSLIITPTQAASIANQQYANQLNAWQAQQQANLAQQQLDLDRWKTEQSVNLSRKASSGSSNVNPWISDLTRSGSTRYKLSY